MAIPSLAMIPSGFKATKLYSVLPTDGTGDFTVTRAGKKNRVNSELNLEIVDANVPSLNYDAIGGCPVLNTEPQADNLITYPISFSNAYWTKSGATIDDNTGAGYSAPSVDFPTSAFKLVEDTSTGSHKIYKNNTSVTASAKVTISFYAKENGRDWIFIDDWDGNGGFYFDLKNGVIGTIFGVPDNYGFEEMANGWFRLWVTNTEPSTSADFSIYTCNADNSLTYTGDGTSGVYIFMAQLETGSVATSPTFTDITLADEGSTTTRLQDLQYISAANSTAWDFTSGDFSFVFDVNFNDLSSSPIIYGKGLFNTDGWYVQITNLGKVIINGNQSVSNQQTLSADGDIIINTDVKIVVTRSGASVKIYKNGVDITATSGTHINPASASAKNLYLGNYNTLTKNSNSNINNFQIYDTELTPTQVANL